MPEQQQDLRTFGEILKSHRKTRKVSARLLKMRAENGRKIHIGAIETNKVAPPVANDIIAMARVLDLTDSDTQALLCKAVENQRVIKVAVTQNDSQDKVNLLMNFIQKWKRLGDEQAKELNQLISKY